MAKKKAGKKKPELKFRELTFSVCDLPGCCGIGVVSNFYEQEEYSYAYGWNVERTPNKPKFATKEEQAEDCYKRILKGTWGEDVICDEYSCLMISLVSCYGPKEDDPYDDDDEEEDLTGKAQQPELEDILQREGWQINQVFINPNHGNEVTLYTKYFPERTELQDDAY